MKRAIGAALAALSLMWSGSAAAAVVVSGVVGPDEGGGFSLVGGYLGEQLPGVYTFKSDASIIGFDDVQATLFQRYHGHADDGSQSWGDGAGGPISWSEAGVPEPLVTYTADGFTFTVEDPGSPQIHSDGCFFVDVCGYTEYWDRWLDIYMVIKVDPADAGKAWEISYSALPATPAPVPEPATWAMMIIGFGAIGSAIRRRRSPAITA